MQVVLRFSDHRDLTAILKEKVERELRDNLRAAFGDMAQVEVVRTHPRLEEIEKKGLQALDAWKEVSDTKTHFVLIDYVDNSFYEIRARQHDGLTGQASPVIRRERADSRDFLARTIGFVLNQDFGVIGEITKPIDESTVELTLKGAGLGVPLTRWVQPGDVFNLVEIAHAGDGRQIARPQPWLSWALLQAQDVPNENGVVKCRFFHRFQPSFSPGSTYRCMKLGTTSKPLRVRLVQFGEKFVTGLQAYKVRVQRHGWGQEREGEETATDSEGFTRLFGKGQPFNNVAFVIIYKNANEKLAQVPVAILDDRPVVIALNPKKDPATLPELKFRNWVKRINDRLLEDQGLFAKLNQQQPEPGRLNDTIDEVNKAKVALQEDIENLKSERKQLVAEAEATGVKVNLDYKEGDQRIQLLERDRDELDKYIDGLQKVAHEENDPKRLEARAKWKQAQALERDKDFDQAIKLYEEAQQILSDASLANKIKELKAAWEPKSDAHKEARRFIYKDWPQFDEARMKERIEKARKAFEVCRQAKDYLAPQKLLRVAIAHDAKLQSILAGLNGSVNEEDQQPTKEALERIKELANLMKDVGDYLKEALKE